MKTIKLPYTSNNNDLIIKLINQSSSMIKIAYNRFKDGYSEKDIRNLSKSYNNIELLNSWLIQSCIKKAKNLFEKDRKLDKTSIFGGKFNFTQRSKQKINKQDFKLKTRVLKEKNYIKEIECLILNYWKIELYLN